METTKKPTWRILITPPTSGAWNMAIDEAIAIHAGCGDALPTLRFYQWQPPCVSLGRHQPLADLDLARCRELGYGIVRRPTGGRAILHIDELTYSVMGKQSEPALQGAVLDSYLRLSQGLLSGLDYLGLDVRKAPASSRAGNDAGPICFEVPSAYEIVAGGKKLVGSAQSRRQGWVLQHGTLPLTGDITRLIDTLALAGESEGAALRRDLAGRATTASQVLGQPVSFQQAAQALRQGFADALGLNLVDGELSEVEQQTAQQLFDEKYANEGWSGKF